MDEYAEAGVPEYWVIELEAQNVTGYRLLEGRYVLVARARPGERIDSATVAGVGVDVAAVFD